MLGKGTHNEKLPKRPSPTATLNADFESKTSHTLNSREINKSLPKEAYIELELGEKKCRCMLDTRSDVMLLPASIIRGLSLRPSTTELRAVKGMKIPILGESMVNAKLSDKKIQFTSLAMEHVDELLLCLARLQEQNECGSSEIQSCCWRAQISTWRTSSTTNL